MTNCIPVMIFTNHLLHYSETFIKAQSEALVKYRPFYVASFEVKNGLSIDEKSRVILRNTTLGTIKDICMKLGWVTPLLHRTILQRKCALIHAHFGPNGLTAIGLAKQMKVPVIITFHGYDITIEEPTKAVQGPLHKRFRDKLEYVAQQGSKFVAVSDFVKRKLINAGFPEHKIVRHYIGINTELFSVDNRIKREKLVVQVGRLVEYKGQKCLITAMQKVQTKHSDYTLVLIGDGEQRAELENYAKELKVNVLFTGKITQTEVLQYLRKAKVYTQTSLQLKNGHEEALALSIVEAQAVGTPAVVFNSGGMPEAISPDQTGFCVPCGDVEALSASVCELIENSELWETFSKNAVEHAKTKHNLQKQSEALEKIYDDVLAEQIK